MSGELGDEPCRGFSGVWRHTHLKLPRGLVWDGQKCSMIDSYINSSTTITTIDDDY